MSKFKSSIYTIGILVIIAMIISSCSTSSNSRTSRYSSSNKRAKIKNDTNENKSYTYHKTKNSDATRSSGNKAVSSLREQIVSNALKYEGTKYSSGGKTPDSGFDCSGFTGYIFTQNGIPLSGPSHKLAELGKLKTQKELLPGDLVFFGNEERISHVAIVSDASNAGIKVVHATTSAGVKIDEITSSTYWTSRFLFGRDVISK